jgi:hypothetical protein
LRLKLPLVLEHRRCNLLRNFGTDGLDDTGHERGQLVGDRSAQAAAR